MTSLAACLYWLGPTTIVLQGGCRWGCLSCGLKETSTKRHTRRHKHMCFQFQRPTSSCRKPHLLGLQVPPQKVLGPSKPTPVPPSKRRYDWSPNGYSSGVCHPRSPLLEYRDIGHLCGATCGRARVSVPGGDMHYNSLRPPGAPDSGAE